MPNDPNVEFETALTDLLTERDRFLERRLRLAAARSGLNKEVRDIGRRWKAPSQSWTRWT